MSFNTDAFFQEVTDLVLDMSQNPPRTGILTADGISTFNAETSQITINPLTDLSLPIPAFALRTPITDLKPGDIVIMPGSKQKRFVVSTADGSVQTMGPAGTETSTKVPDNTLFGAGAVLAVKSMTDATSTSSLNPMLMAMLLSNREGGSSIDPFLLMAMSPAAASAPMNPMMMMALMAKKKSR
jgi:hypothetical protein